ncbi:hypothetical protein [Aureivirga sp. CE67]|uniref:hypothetical protein n=1 Tax=Aureivirga sp. CE67 TaxID=1788983 RepID=UPI0018C8E40A|nr:hypothetical protein [Aureivirga sp. CE67]
MILFLIAIALASIFLWVNYFRTIDIFEKDSILDTIISLLIGISLVFVIFLYDQYLYVQFEGTNKFLHFVEFLINDALLKTILLFGAFYLLNKYNKKVIKEPIDQIMHASLISVGLFNVDFLLKSLQFTSTDLFSIDSIFTMDLCTNVCATAIFTYGFVLKEYKKPANKNYVAIFLGLSFIYRAGYLYFKEIDYLIGFPSSFSLMSLLFFIFTMPILRIIINNSLNQSPFFSFKKTINSRKVRTQMLLNFTLIFLLQNILIIRETSFEDSYFYLMIILFFTGYAAAITSFSLNDFKLIQGKWLSFKLKFPIYRRKQGNLGIRGFSGEESYFIPFYEENFFLCDINQNISQLGGNQVPTRIIQKIYFEGDELGFLAEVQEEFKQRKVILYPKLDGVSIMENKYPIVNVYSLNQNLDFTKDNYDLDDFIFLYPQKMVPMEKEVLVLN